MSIRPHAIGALAMLLLALATAPLSAATPSPHRATVGCTGSMDVPLKFEFANPDAHIAPGQIVTLNGTITAEAPLDQVEIALRTEGSVTLVGPQTISMGSIGSGAHAVAFTAQFQIPRAQSPGTAAVIATVHAVNAETHASYQKEDGVYAITRGSEFRASTGAYVTASVNAIRADLAAGLISDDDAAGELRTATTVPGAWDSESRPAVNVPHVNPQDLPVLQSIQPTIPPNYTPRIARNGVTSGDVTFQGNISWTASDASVHPAYGVTVTVWEVNILLPIPIPVSSMATGTDGNYNMRVFVPPGTATFVDFVTSNAAVAHTPGLPPAPYGAASSPVADPSDPQTWNFTAANTGTGPAVGLHTMATFEAASLAIRNGGTFLGFLPIVWPGSSGSAFYDGVHINLRPLDRYAYDVQYHEYGHYVMDSFNFEDNPGGPHNIGDCISQVHGSKDQGNRLAWGEGWPTYWGTTVQHDFGLPGAGIPTVGDETYTDTEAGAFSYSLENDSEPPASQDAFGLGEDNEIAVQRALWDLVDPNNDNRDNVTISDVTLLNLFHNTNLTTFSAAWALVRGTLSDADQLAYGAVITDAGIGPRPTAPSNGGHVSPGGSTFTWDGNVGCPSSYTGDGYVLRFFNPSTKAPVMSFSGIGSPTRTLSTPEMASLITAGGHNLLWAVEGSNSSSPATGPYLGDNRAVVVNRPPHADAGPDQTVECTGNFHAPATLNGTGSSDPDGDALTYTWTASGIIFNNSHSATPTASFPEGPTVVTLVVSDGIDTDTDQITVNVVDTTPPVVHCPTSITVECSQSGGTPASDPAIAAFLSAATASDICDPNPVVTNDAPIFFHHGPTVVTFTGTDNVGKHSSCSSTVNVVDTTPPTLTVSLDRDVLWPPNHKLVEIHANITVTDICDPNPTFQLVSITSNEPDNGLGDGDTPNDIQNAAYGTPDLAFSLRAERSGTGSGRRYTITYTASDADGNTTTKSVVVRVPHDSPGGAMASLGFGTDGTAFIAGAQQFSLIVRSIPRSVIEDPSDPQDSQLGGPSAPQIRGLDFDAQWIDSPRAYIGNTAGVLTPVRTDRLDADNDGFVDLVVTYNVAEALALKAASTVDDGPVGLHYATRTSDYLVSDIFALGSPLMVTLPEIVSSSGDGTPDPSPGERRHGGNGPAAAATAPVTQAPASQAPVVQTPEVTELAGMMPNPARGRETTVSYNLAHDAAVELAVYDVAGARVRTLAAGQQSAGRYQVRWDGRSDSGQKLTNGVYFVRLVAGKYMSTKKAVLMP